MVVDPNVWHGSVSRWTVLGPLFFGGVFLLSVIPSRVRRLLLGAGLAVLVAGTAASVTSTAVIWNGLECCDLYIWMLPWLCAPMSWC